MYKKALFLIVLLCVARSESNLARNLGEMNVRVLQGSSNPDNAQDGDLCTVNCGWNTIEVNGAGALIVNPDVATVSVQVTANGPDTNAAISNLAQKIKIILKTLTSSGLSSTNWQTNYLSVYANSSYVNGTYVTFGQIAYESLTLTIPIPNANGSIIAKIYDGLAQISDINIYGLAFNLKDKTSAYVAARKLAYQDAVQRAKDYLNAAGLTLGQAETISDYFSGSTYISPSSSATSANAAIPTTVSVGTITINYSVNVVFAFK